MAIRPAISNMRKRAAISVLVHQWPPEASWDLLKLAGLLGAKRGFPGQPPTSNQQPATSNRQLTNQATKQTKPTTQPTHRHQHHHHHQQAATSHQCNHDQHIQPAATKAPSLHGMHPMCGSTVGRSRASSTPMWHLRLWLVMAMWMQSWPAQSSTSSHMCPPNWDPTAELGVKIPAYRAEMEEDKQ